MGEFILPKNRSRAPQKGTYHIPTGTYTITTTITLNDGDLLIGDTPDLTWLTHIVKDRENNRRGAIEQEKQRRGQLIRI